MPGQTPGPMPLGAAYIYTRHGRHRASGTSRRRAAGLPRPEPGSAGPLRRPAPEWRTDLDRVRGEFGQRDHRQTHEQEAADAPEQGNRAAFLDVRTTVLNDTLADAFRRRYPGFCPANDDEAIALAA